MGAISNLLGGGQNSGFQAQNAVLNNPVNQGQIQNSLGNVSYGLTQQQDLINALQAQNGIGNQSNVFNQQQGLANQLQAETQGAGPNPAQAQLAQNTAANTANQASLMAGQRGAGQNVGLIARQAAQQGAANQQGAVGQAATLQAQQQLAAQSQLQNQQNMLGNLATTQVGQQTGAIGNFNNLAQGQAGLLLGANNAQNQANIANTSQLNQANAGIAGVNAKNTAGALGGIGNAAGGALPLLRSTTTPPAVQAQGLLSTGAGEGAGALGASEGAASGIEAGTELGSALVAEGGVVADAPRKVENPKLAQVPQKDRISTELYPEHLKAVGEMYHPHHFSNVRTLPKGTPSAPIMKEGKQIGEAPLEARGGTVPGEPKVVGNSYKNDTVPALLSPKEIVIPDSITMANDAPEKAKQFVAEELQKHYGKEHGDFKEALKSAMKNRKERK